MAKHSAKTKDGWQHEAGRGVIAVDGTTKAKIERAALSLFMVRGVDGVSIKELAAHAGISDGAMYRYYPSKYNLAHTLMLAIHNRLTKLVREVDSGDDNFKAKIKNLVTNYCAAADDDWQLFSYHLLHLHHFPELFTKGPTKRKKLDSPVTACADMLESAMKAGDIPNGNTELLASMALGVVIQGASAKSYGRLSGPLSIYAPEFERAIWAIVKQK
ncbi:MAG: TetR/AcrR family transcriptional regulator [Robiginitomaculum sp.]|nr:TetR/AcrR family transcriptional regulator [Robiginitomaculum sp.]